MFPRRLERSTTLARKAWCDLSSYVLKVSTFRDNECARDFIDMTARVCSWLNAHDAPPSALFAVASRAIASELTSESISCVAAAFNVASSATPTSNAIAAFCLEPPALAALVETHAGTDGVCKSSSNSSVAVASVPLARSGRALLLKNATAPPVAPNPLSAVLGSDKAATQALFSFYFCCFSNSECNL